MGLPIGRKVYIFLVNLRMLRSESFWVSLVAQWLRIRLPMQGTRVRALVREDPTCHGATKPVHHNYRACTRARESQLLSPHATTTEARVPRACAPQQKKPPQWEAHAPQRRVDPACCNEDPTQPKKKKLKKKKVRASDDVNALAS